MHKELTNKKIEIAIDRAIELLAKNNLSGWTVKIFNKRSTIAETFHLSKTIYYSKSFMLLANKEQFDGVTLHEVAHAILGAGVGHSTKFVELCTRISHTSLYACARVDIPLGKYIFTCPRCGHSGSNNNTKTIYCARCFNNDTEIIEFEIAKNKRKIIFWE